LIVEGKVEKKKYKFTYDPKLFGLGKNEDAKTEEKKEEKTEK
jgi:hypothetical protein